MARKTSISVRTDCYNKVQSNVINKYLKMRSAFLLTYNISFALVQGRFLHSFQCILRILVSLTRAQMHFRKVTMA